MSRTDPIQFTTTDGRAVVIRVFEPTDAAALLECSAHESRHSDHIYTETDEFLAEYDEQKEREAIEAWLSSEGSLGLGVFPLDASGSETGECVGSLMFKAPDNRRRARHRGTFGIAVLPAWQGGGIGTAMITSMLDWARAHSFIELVALGSYHTNERALKLYERLGFIEEGRRTDFFRFRRPDGSVGYADDVQMVLRVKPRGYEAPETR